MDTPVETKSAPDDRAENGPFDESEVSGVRPWIDLQSLKLIPREGLNIRLEVEDGTGNVVAASLDYNGSTLQVQPFAASRNDGLWAEIREQLIAGLREQGGQVAEVSGPLGPEIHANIPVMTAEGVLEQQPARFIGVDGPRWFLRGVIAGPAAIDPGQGADMIDIFRGLVVVRGSQPLPPRELLPLRVPSQPGVN